MLSLGLEQIVALHVGSKFEHSGKQRGVQGGLLAHHVDGFLAYRASDRLELLGLGGWVDTGHRLGGVVWCLLAPHRNLSPTLQGCRGRAGTRHVLCFLAGQAHGEWGMLGPVHKPHERRRYVA